MDSQRKSFVLLITIFLSLFLQSPICQAARSPNSAPLPPVVKQLCAKTAASEPFCIKTFESDKRTWGAKTFADLTKIFLSIGENDARHTAKIISGLVKKEGVTPKSKEAIEMCAHSYNHIGNNFNSALGEVKEGDSETANYDVMVCMDDIKSCKFYLSDAKLSIKVITDAFDVTNYFINIGATFTNIV